MFAVCYVMGATFHPGLKLNQIIVERSFAHSFEKLLTVDYLTEEQMTFIDVKAVKQLKDVAEHNSKRNCKKYLAQMTFIEHYLVKHTLMSWLNRKIKSQHL